jgi:hypothetical protein
MAADRVDPRIGEPRGGVRLSRTKGGERTWQVSLAIGDDPAELRRTIQALIELDAELARAYSDSTGDPKAAPRVHVPSRHDEEPF